METLSRIAGAFTGSTAISAAIAAISLWVVWVERKDRTMVWKAGCAMAVLGVLGIVFTISEGLASQDNAAELARQLKNTTHNLEETRAKAAAAASSAKRLEAERTGLLPQEAWNKIASAPAPSLLGGGIALCSQNPNAKELATQLESALSQAGWALARSEIDIPIQGVVVLVNSTHSQKSKEHGQQLFDTLEGAGVAVELIWNGETPMNFPFWVMVGTPIGLEVPANRRNESGTFEIKETIVDGPSGEEAENDSSRE